MGELEAERRQMLKEAGLTQEGAAALFSISRNSIVRWFKGGDQVVPAIVTIDGQTYRISIPIELGLNLLRAGKAVKTQIRLPKKNSTSQPPRSGG